MAIKERDYILDNKPYIPNLYIWEEAYSFCLRNRSYSDMIMWFKNQPSVCLASDHFFLSELAWCIFNSSMRETVIRKKWPDIKTAFMEFQPDLIISAKEEVKYAALQVFNHKGKINAVITGAERIIKDSPIGKKISLMKEEEILSYLVSYLYIGNITKYHLARNLGFDCVKPDRHLVRLAKFLGFSDPFVFVEELSLYTGEKKGVIDYVLWQWLAEKGEEAYTFISETKKCN